MFQRLPSNNYFAPQATPSGYLPMDWSPSYSSVTGSSAPSTAGGNWLRTSGFLDNKGLDGITEQGWGMPAIGAAKGLFDSWMAMKSYGLGKKRLAEDKRQFGLNFDAQMRTTNSALEDRQRARVASNAGAYQSVGEYMNKNAIKGG